MQEQPMVSDGAEAMAVTSQIAFYNELQHESPEQFALFMDSSRLVEYKPGEVVVNKQDKSKVFYALLRGSVDVFSSETRSELAISQLSSGQLFGFLAVLNGENRTATLAASAPDGAKVLATDFSMAGDLLDFSKVTLQSKLMLYRNAVNNTRWKLEVYKNTTNDPTLAQELSLYGLFQGEKGSVEELKFLAEQSLDLASLLESWNDVVEPNISVPAPAAIQEGSKLNKVMSMFKKR